MRIFTPDIKTVKELTKYIRPSEIEKVRYKKFNAPKIDDGNILCDEFFRTEELFDRKSDVVSGLRTYGLDDVALTDNSSSLKSVNTRNLQGSNSCCTESDLPYYVDIIGTKERIYLEQYGTKSPKYPHEEMAGDKYPELTVDEVVNINYHARKLAPGCPTEILRRAYDLLRDGYPLEGVINLLYDSATRTSKGEVVDFQPSLFRFLAKYPKFRSLVITHNISGKENFDVDAAIMFPKLYKACEEDAKLAGKIIEDCRKELYQYDTICSDKHILQTAINLLKTDGKWTDDKIKIIELIKTNHFLAVSRFTGRVNNMLNENASLKEIIKMLDNNH